jgi:uncharacterized protein (TIGR03118 family)
MTPRNVKRLVAAGLAAAALLVVGLPAWAAVDNAYTVHPLVSDQPGAAPVMDGNLVNPWGLVSSSSSPWWVADNVTNLSTLYNGAGGIVPLVVNVPGAPTGLVFNGDSSSFKLPAGGAARFIFASQDGIIRGWNGGPDAQLGVDDSAAGSSYTGLAIATTSSGPHLYAADFPNAEVDVFDASWDPVSAPDAFVDPRLPEGYAPFGIQAIGSRIFVAYAKQDEEGEDEVAGQGLGIVDVYDTEGGLLGRVAQHGQLNAPWGIAQAPD